MKELLTYIVQKLVDHTDDVKITEVSGEHTTIFELTVNKEDLGKVIGKEGRTAKAIRTVLSAASIKENKRVMLEILD
ncbi:MAG: KH domain-containing protein [Bdellovibrionales bacterium]|nr:KH domain-containing protein [Bdellovibrionales bacterium]